MEIYKNISTQTKQVPSECAVALGMFDGVHRGHCRVIEAAMADHTHLKATVLSFTTDVHRPRNKMAQKDILSVTDRLALMQQLGIRCVYLPDFEEIRDVPAQEFVQHILMDRLAAKVICCGNDFRFGKQAQGDVQLLRELCRQRGVTLKVVPPVMDEGKPVSSTRIRCCLMQGDMESANRLLGYRYFIKQPVSYGKQLGRKLGFPTMNQQLPSNICIPRYGAYISTVWLDQKEYPAITNIGVHPSVQGVSAPIAETHIIGYQQSLYHTVVTVKLVSFMRDEHKFSQLSQLREQLQKDREAALTYFSKKVD